jgi:lysophospholipase L1-like esterase
MKNLRTLTVIALASSLALAGAASAQVSFEKYVALGDSLTAGYASGGLTQAYQQDSYPAIMARQFGTTNFAQPLVSDPGIPAVLELQQLMFTSSGVVPVILPKSTAFGMPLNATYPGPYNNLGIPGATVGDLLTKTGDITRLATGQSTADTVMYDLILRDGVNPAINQAIGAAGTFYTVWIGNNDVLGAAISGVALDGVTLTPVSTFQTEYTTLLGALRQSRKTAQIVVANIPDVTAIPFVTAIPPYVYTPQGQKFYLIGEAGPLTDGDYLTLGASSYLAQGYGLSPAMPLPEGGIDPNTGEFHDGVILRASEIQLIRERTQALNGVIAAVAGQVGAKLLNVNSIFADIKEHGVIVGGVQLSADFLTGGIFSYDGIHPQNLGYAIVANDFIKVINAEFGANVPQVDLRPYLLGTAASTSVQRAATIFSREAFEQLVATMVPAARADNLGVTHVTVRGPEASRIVRGIGTPRHLP